MGIDESHFNVSLIVRDKVTRQCPQTTTFEEKGEPKRYRTEVLRLPAYRLTAKPNRLSRVLNRGDFNFYVRSTPPAQRTSEHSRFDHNKRACDA